MFFKTHSSLKDTLKVCKVVVVRSSPNLVKVVDRLNEIKGTRSKKHLAGFFGKVY